MGSQIPMDEGLPLSSLEQEQSSAPPTHPGAVQRHSVGPCTQMAESLTIDDKAQEGPFGMPLPFVHEQR